MADIEKVTKGLEICNSVNHPCNECPYLAERNCSLAMVSDALELLKSSVSAELVKQLLRSGISLDTDADKEYVCGLIDEMANGRDVLPF